jgi:hypothetical protein
MQRCAMSGRVLTGFTIGAVLAAAVVLALPDTLRYLRIRRM